MHTAPAPAEPRLGGPSRTAHHRANVIPGAASWMMGFMGKGLNGGRPAPRPAGSGGFMTQRSGGSPGSPAGELLWRKAVVRHLFNIDTGCPALSKP